jgi:hypothetical protein
MLSNTWKNFKNYAEFGPVPTVEKNGNLVPQNSFYESVHYVDSVVGPIKDALCGVRIYNDCDVGNRKKAISPILGLTVFALANIVLQS